MLSKVYKIHEHFLSQKVISIGCYIIIFIIYYIIRYISTLIGEISCKFIATIQVDRVSLYH